MSEKQKNFEKKDPPIKPLIPNEPPINSKLIPVNDKNSNSSNVSATSSNKNSNYSNVSATSSNKNSNSSNVSATSSNKNSNSSNVSATSSKADVTHTGTENKTANGGKCENGEDKSTEGEAGLKAGMCNLMTYN